MSEIEAFFDCSCVWVYLAMAHLGRFADEAQVPVRWRPVVMHEVFATVNPAATAPLNPAKQAYYRRDLAEWAAWLELPLAPAPRPPADSTELMRACVAAERLGRLEPFARAVLAAIWGEGRDLADRSGLAPVWEAVGLPGALFAPSIDWPDTAAHLTANTRELMARGGFGVPSFLVGEELYFGNDAIPLVERAVRLRRRLQQAG